MSYKSLIEQKLTLLPELPGCYLMKNAADEIIYVGKAKSLKARVRSYFKQAHNGKTQLLVNDIADFEYIVTHTNKESLLLEINLIKKYQPKYNIKLKAGSMYPYLKITNEDDPQLVITNHIDSDGALYFGPYPDVTGATTTQQLLHKIYPLRRCAKHEKRGCFYYHLDQCIGCCDHPISKATYQQRIKKIQRFLQGDVREIKADLTQKMRQASEALAFEKAADYRNQIHYIETTVEKQYILSKDYTNTDVFGYAIQDGFLSIQVFLLRQSSIIKREATIFQCYGSVEDEVVSYILQFYSDNNHLIPKEIVVPDTIDTNLLAETLDCTVTVPQKSKKKQLLDLTTKNSQLAVNEHIRLLHLKDTKTVLACDELAQALNIPSASHIESFDHSNTQGTNPVSTMVVYLNGVKQPKLYRKYKVKTVVGSHEHDTTQEIIRRRYSRLLKENGKLPDLILMDGGLIQVNAAKDVLENELGLTIPVAGMVKDDRHNTAQLIFGDPLTPIDLPRQSQSFRLVQRIQEEVHRFSVTFHRQLRSKQALSSQLDGIVGVGPKTKQLLLTKFKTLTAIKQATIDELIALGINKKTAQSITNWSQLNN